jgi:hypothetical protein
MTQYIDLLAALRSSSQQLNTGRLMPSGDSWNILTHDWLTPE